MLSFRRFKNFDPPAVAEVWHSLAGQPGWTQPLPLDVLEQLVFAKLYFDPRGFFVAFGGSRPVGFAHAGFGPNAAYSGIDPSCGVVCAAAVRPEGDPSEAADGLLAQCEDYLAGRGATVVYGGTVRPENPFYLGLYGGRGSPGVLDSEMLIQQAYRRRGYRDDRRVAIVRRTLPGAVGALSPRLHLLRRQVSLDIQVDLPARNWWEACLDAAFETVRFGLVARKTGARMAQVLVRDMAIVEHGRGPRTAALAGIEVDPAARRQGLATLLVTECLRELSKRGFAAAEAHVDAANTPALDLLGRLEFRSCGQGTVFRKELAAFPAQPTEAAWAESHAPIRRT